MTHRSLPVSEQIEKLRGLNESSILLIRKAPQGMRAGENRLGIFPASFNPPTKAHIALITTARKTASLDEVLVLLDAQAMDKEIIGATLEDRVAMLENLFQGDRRVSVGISNQGLFIDKLGPLRRLYPSPAAFFFIVGFDTIERVLDKKYYLNPESSFDHLFKESCFMVANRGEQGRERLDTFLQGAMNRDYHSRISFLALAGELSFISSSLVRERLRAGKSVSEFVPSPVLRFIEEKGLYGRDDE